MKVIFGTMNFGPQLDLTQSREMVDVFLSSNNRELDTAYVYNNGITEEYLGKILPSIPANTYEIATKVHPRITGKLDAECIDFEFHESLRRMRLDGVDLLYFHFPDKVTPVEIGLKKIAELFHAGKIKEFGLSNYPAWSVTEIMYLCDRIGCPRPSVYQGMYNALCRNVEGELFDVVRHFGMRFYAFNPLAGGLLTGKHHHFEDPPEPGRFARLESYRKRYWKKGYFEAIDIIRDECNKMGIPCAEAAYRWLANHSMMRDDQGDGIIIGASSIEQLRQNMAYAEEGPLPDNILTAYEEAWEIAKQDSPAYYKFINS